MLLHPTAILKAVIHEIDAMKLDPDAIEQTLASLRQVLKEQGLSEQSFVQLAQICQLRQSYRKKQGELQTAIKELAGCKVCVYLNGCLAGCLSPPSGIGSDTGRRERQAARAGRPLPGLHLLRRQARPAKESGAPTSVGAPIKKRESDN